VVWGPEQRLGIGQGRTPKLISPLSERLNLPWKGVLWKKEGLYVAKGVAYTTVITDISFEGWGLKKRGGIEKEKKGMHIIEERRKGGTPLKADSVVQMG